ncbi:MAG TPA: hypothetical protein VM934_03500 [Pyrinomonadaceae bacterium]|nr:hypothetical protein [Pyrinomonadaceae bacterium]
MKYLFVLILFAAVAGIIYWRLRPYLKMAGRVLSAVRNARSVSVGNTGGAMRERSGGNSKAAAEKLVRCASCGTWLPASRAVSLRTPGGSSYCSHACLERSAEAPRSTRRSAS